MGIKGIICRFIFFQSFLIVLIKGPDGESSLNVFLLPTFYLIFRAPSERIGNIWMDALELTMRSSNLVKRVLNSTNSTPTSCTSNSQFLINTTPSMNRFTTEQISKINKNTNNIELINSNNNNNNNNNSAIIIESEIENEHFKDIDACDDINLSDSEKNSNEDDCSFNSSIITASVDDLVENTPYIQSPPEEFGEVINSIFFCLDSF